MRAREYPHIPAHPAHSRRSVACGHRAQRLGGQRPVKGVAAKTGGVLKAPTPPTGGRPGGDPAASGARNPGGVICPSCPAANASGPRGSRSGSHFENGMRDSRIAPTGSSDSKPAIRLGVATVKKLVSWPAREVSRDAVRTQHTCDKDRLCQLLQ
jgi:hypothetical protein